MSQVQNPPSRLSPEPLPENIRSVQPGGGCCYSLEIAWGRLRRGWLQRFRPGYVRKMAALRQGDPTGAPHEILDPRDLKWVRNQCACDWDPAHDPFRWRGSLGVTRWGLAELQIMGWPLVILSGLAAWLYWPLGAIPLVVLGWLVYFFRDPKRVAPTTPGLLVAPCDGTIAEVTRLDRDDYLQAPAVRIGIFLSIFNVHINRSPSKARVIKLHYSPGEFLNALNPKSAIRNENLWIGLEEEEAPHRRLIVRQIAGLIARRIVCQLRPGEVLERGAQFGMIKLGSRTELIFPDEPGLEVLAKVGDKVQGGATPLARYGG